MDNPYQHGQQPPTIDMLAVYGGAKEFSGDGFSFDMSQVPPSGQPLLSGTEQNLITDFFAHPDDFSEHVAFGYYKAPSASDTGNGNVNDPALRTHSLSHAIANTSHDGSLQYTNTFSPNYDRNNNRTTNTLSAGDINGMATYTREAMSQNDVAAATTLSGFRNNPPTDSATPFALDGASWGAMSMSGLITNAAAETYASNDRQWLHNSAPRPNNEAGQPRDSNGNLIEMVMGDMQRGTYAAPPSQNSQGSRPFGTYGSDTNFSSGNFAGTAAAVDHTQKTGNLLGIPLLAQAAESSTDGRGNGNNLSVRTSQVPSGQPNYSSQFTPQYSAAWNSAVVGPHSGPNKRRKSNSANGVKQEPNSEDEEAGANSKRRKSMANGYQPTQAQIYAPSYSQMPPPAMQYTQGPMMLPPQDMRRAPTRKKENLTDDQKRANHIISEKKRREIINQGYRDLNDLTPALAMGKSGLSRSECLTEINNYLYALQLANTRLIKDLQLEPSAFAIPAATSQNSLY